MQRIVQHFEKEKTQLHIHKERSDWSLVITPEKREQVCESVVNSPKKSYQICTQEVALSQTTLFESHEKGPEAVLI